MELVFLGGFVQLLQDILGALFDAVLSPVLRDVFNILVNIFGALLHDILSNFLLQIWVVFLKLIYFIEQIFNAFSGISPIAVGDVGNKMPLIQYFFTVNEVQAAFWGITALSMAIAFMTTIIAVMKSMSDMALADKAPISTVIKQAGKAALSFVLIPVCCLFMLRMTTTMVAVVNTTFNPGAEEISVSDVLFITVAGPEAHSSGIRNSYSSAQKYENLEGVKDDFDYEDFDYVMAYVSSIGISLILLCSILQFIQRIITVVVLYLASPFFVSMMPLDGGAKFREWRNMFVAHMFSAFGPILAMKLYFMILPYISSGELQFGADPRVASWVKLLFVIGGTYAVFKSRLLIISAVNPTAAGAMMETGMISSFLVGKATGKMSQAVRGGGGSGKQKQAPKASSGNDSGSQAYKGK